MEYISHLRLGPWFEDSIEVVTYAICTLEFENHIPLYDWYLYKLDAANNPEEPTSGTRKVPFFKVLYIKQDDFMEDPLSKFYRLGPGREVTF